MLDDAHAGVRAEAAMALARRGPEGSDAVPALKQHQKDPDERVRKEVAEALWRIGAEPGERQ